MADQVLCSGVACITDLMVKKGLVNLDFADVCSIMYEMGTAMIGVGEASGERRALRAAEAAIANPLLDETSMKGARGLLISITGGDDLTLYELDEAASRIREEVDDDTNIIVGATFDPALGDAVRVSVVATGIDRPIEIEPVAGQSRADPSQPDAEAVLDTGGACAFEAIVDNGPPPRRGRDPVSGPQRAAQGPRRGISRRPSSQSSSLPAGETRRDGIGKVAGQASSRLGLIDPESA